MKKLSVTLGYSQQFSRSINTFKLSIALWDFKTLKQKDSKHVGTINHCRNIVAVGPVVDIEEVPTGFRGVYQHGVDTDSFVHFFDNYVVQPEVQLLSSGSDGSTIYHSPSQRSEPSIFSSHPDENSSSTSSSSASPMDFIADIPQLEQSPTAITQLSLPTADVTTPYFTESFAQLRESVNQIHFEQVQTRDDVKKLKHVGTINHCRNIEAVGPVVDIEEVPTGFRGVYQHGVDTDSFVHFFDNYVVQQSHPDENSSSTSSSSASPMDFIADIPQLEQSPTAITQLSLPTADVTTPYFTESFAQLRESVNQIHFEQVQTRDDVKKLKYVLLLHIRGLERRFTEISDQQDRAY
ncbi:hypothetical protein F511_34025 [Dorcoceras hygrometricum]|uniref:Uncharacterized protein n=1 Tax=Dorcoceras hygrometricum TaxID=472368 RepID=A0A2Z7AS19_9LAMI|nr:hypothetical protein F511_34025 [Dorcoceras hygrometricum]